MLCSWGVLKKEISTPPTLFTGYGTPLSHCHVKQRRTDICFYYTIFHLVYITWRPVGTCFASFTLAKLPRPMVLTKRYLPTCCKSSGGLARSAPPWDAFWTAVCSTQLHIIPTIPSKTSGGKWPKNSNRIWTACRRYRSMHHEFIIHKHMLTLHKFLKPAQN